MKRKVLGLVLLSLMSGCEKAKPRQFHGEAVITIPEWVVWIVLLFFAFCLLLAFLEGVYTLYQYLPESTKIRLEEFCWRIKYRWRYGK